MIKYLSLSMLSLLMVVNTYGQPVKEKAGEALLLKNHTINLASLEKLSPEQFPVFDGFTYLIIQDINNLKHPEGLQYKSYIPKNAGLYQVEISKLAQVLAFADKNHAAYTPLRASWKLSNRLFSGDIPEWAWLNGQDIKVWVQLYPDANLVKAKVALALAGEEILEVDTKNQLIALSVNADRAKTLANYPFVMQVQEMEDPGTPENWTARTSHRINYLQSEIPGTTNYDGTGVTLSLGDDGAIGPHIDYAGRLDQSSAGASSGDHGDHVAGTIFGAGNIDPKGRGMAPGLDMVYYSYPGNLSNADSDYNTNGVVITSSSYSNGCNAGYTNFTRQMDDDYDQNPNLLHVFSAGNSGTSNCGYGAGAGWGNVTGGHKIAKNVIAVANLTRLDALAGSSSRGPASDGRIKPDVGAVGTSVYSTTDVNSYTLKTGTSMSCPGTSGTISVLYQAYKETHAGTTPNSALIKAILMNSAEDLGNPGPDFRFGYGRINARKALEAIENDQFFSGSLNSTGTAQHTITVPNNVSEVKVMLYWGDVTASTIAARALVNDLDMSVVSGGTTFLPWVLNPTPTVAALNSNAVRARDSLNNAEQVTISNPAAGDVTVNLSAFNIPQGSQSYYLVYTFVEDTLTITHPVGGEKFVPGTTEIIRWDAPTGTGNVSIEYSIDNGATWQNVASNVAVADKYYNWTVPNTITGVAKVRVIGTNTTASPGNFTIIGVPQNLTYVSACPDSLSMTWDLVPQAVGYVVYRLGNKYMDSIGYTVSNVFKAPGIPLVGDEYFAVAAVSNNVGIGLRSNSLVRPPGLFNCEVKKDLSVTQLLSPPDGNIPDCFTLNNIPIKARLSNTGLDSIFGFMVSYQFGSNAVVSTTLTDTIAPGATFIYTSNGTVTIPSSASINTSIWITLNGDRNPYNDTVNAQTQYYVGQTKTFPYSDDLETNIPQCNTNTNCGGTSCALNGGWYNYPGLSIDDADWRGNAGSTASANTGPSVDQNPGTALGKYLYTEASDCFNSNIWVQTPCVNLTNATSPLFSFYYHMSGNNMGDLTVDVYDGDKWDLDVFTLSGDQGPNWNKGTFSLSDYIGKTVMVRFRATTGSDFASDIAIDDISFSENLNAPVASFTAGSSVTCINGTVQFSSTSTSFPTTFNWSVSPATTANFVASNSTSPNVAINFTAAGSYSVTLTATNALGSNTVTRTAVVTASAGQALSAYEDFDANGIPATWAIVNPDNFTAWEAAPVIGSNGVSTTAVRFDNFTNPAANTRDDLIGINVDLINQNAPLLYFDLAYAPNLSNASDSLIIMVSTDCGTSFMRTTYAKGAAGLATATARNSRFIPTNANQWVSDSLDLTPFVGENIKVNFVAKSAKGNALYLDNIQLVNGSVQAPNVSMGTTNNVYCVNDTVTFTANNSAGAATVFNWNFGAQAVPKIATGPGPHKVIYLAANVQTATLAASNAGGRSNDQITLNIERGPVSVFNSAINNYTVTFSDLSINNPTAWSWDFGDGNTSTAQNPVHTYTSTGVYTVEQFVSNACGTSSRTITIVISAVGLSESSGIKSASLFPNPTNGLFTLSVDVLAGSKATINITDLSGKLLSRKEVNLNAGENPIALDLTNAAAGIYMVQVKTDAGAIALRAIKQ